MSRRRVLVDRLPQSGNNRVPLSSDEAVHLSSVLRLSDGDEVEAIDGRGSWAHGILRLKKKVAEVEIDFDSLQTESSPTTLMTLVTAPLKGDAMDWLIEKAVELGATSLHPVVTDHSVVRVRGDKGPAELQTRWQRIADQALKQCGRRYRLEISPPCPLPEWLGTAAPGVARAWLHESERQTSPHLASWLQKQDRKLPLEILLGPEGGFSYAEIEMLGRSGLFSPVSLGSTILRAETAGIAAIVLAGAHEVTG